MSRVWVVSKDVRTTRSGHTGRMGTVLGLADDTSIIVLRIEGKFKLISNTFFAIRHYY